MRPGAQTVERFVRNSTIQTRGHTSGQGNLMKSGNTWRRTTEIGLVIFDDELSSKQVTNIEKELKVKILPDPNKARLL